MWQRAYFWHISLVYKSMVVCLSFLTSPVATVCYLLNENIMFTFRVHVWISFLQTYSPRLIQTPPGLRMFQMVSTYCMTLWAVSIKKQVATQSQESDRNRCLKRERFYKWILIRSTVHQWPIICHLYSIQNNIFYLGAFNCVHLRENI